ncbi:MAG TPA: AI-2E family transporter [Cyclobacteriaceae bacterium]|nr:AI-2E family transporter [Cyclobacteriaceae bacterium]
MEVSKPFNRLDYTFKLSIIISLAILATVAAADIIVPLLISAFLAVILRPVVTWLEKKLSLTFSVIVVLFFTLIVFIGIMWVIGDQLTRLIQDLPNLESKFNTLVDNISNEIRSVLGMSRAEQNQMERELIRSVSSYVGGLLVSTTNTLSLLIQLPIYIFLFLIYRDRFTAFFISLLPNTERLKWKQDIESVLQGYISGLLIVTVIITVLNTVGLLALGIEHAIFFGVISGILTVIPYVGIFIGATLPAVFALLTKDSAWYAFGVVAVFSFVQFLEGNFITPRITGSKVSINALAAIVALLIGGKILGIAGMILAVPIMGVLKVILSHTTHLKPFVILIEDSNGETEKVDEAKPSD